MLENPTLTAPDSSTVKRYAPPNQRNRPLNRRKSGDRLDRTNTYGTDAEKHQLPASRSIPIMEYGDAGTGAFLNEAPRPSFIGLEGCSRSEASQLLNERWAAVMHLYNDTTIDLSERPSMYMGSNASPWGQIRLPHQMMSSANVGPPLSSQMDFLGELRRSMSHTKSSYNN